MSKFQEKINKLPKAPGVYLFKDKTGEILYIGKATSLKDRVRSYFNGSDERGGRIFSMVSQIAKIETIETDSALEALILEANLIKKHQPKYNIKERDDKSFSYVALIDGEFPRFEIFRETELNQISNLKFLISNQIPIFNSKISKKNLKANSYKLKAIYGPYTSKKNLEVALGIIRKIFPYHSLKQKTEKGCLDFQIGRCPGPYAGEISRKDYTKNILGIKMILEGKKKNLVRKMEKDMKELAKKNEFEKAGELRNKIFALNHINDIALISANNEQRTMNNKIRIEAYDISNISGQYAVGSMVVFEDNEPNKKEYRKFKIKTVEGSNDVGMMAEVLFRRFRNNWPTSTRGESTRGWSKPDLILLDGGKGHLNMASRVLKELDLDIPMIAVAKGKTRKNIKLQMTNSKQISNLKSQISKILDNKILIKQVMDEAHRFAISYHRKLRKKDFI